jgi:CheY-like chemotaxis protein
MVLLRDLPILVVDDDERVSEVLALILEGEGACPHTACTAREAMAICGRVTPAAIITDLRMPGEDGAWLLTRLRATLPDVPVIAISGIDDAGFAAGAGFDAFIQKPVTIADLCGVLRAVLEARSA